ncbi:S8 family peptidase [Streptomyces sp. NPDC004327]|uniref:S8 family peptidase n=1 Tax=Streptomyces sp. NPDC004327 TaxID=3364699 RepID=UPI00368237BF
MRPSLLGASAALVLALPALSAPAASGAPSDGAATPAPLRKSAKAIEGQYIVMLSAGYDAEASATKVPGVTPLFTYKGVFPGFAARLTPAQLQAVRTMPGVAAVEEDAEVTAAPVTASPAAAGRTRAAGLPSASWGLDRIDQPYLPLDNQFTANGTGKGVTAYIVDTGIDFGHAEFGGRATAGFDAIGDGYNGQDCNGHGTHVAGTVGGSVHGVAREVDLVSVRVLNCQGKGSWSGIIAGFDWVAQNAKQPAVLNGSLGGPKNVAVNVAATAVSDKNVLPVLAAGNSAQDACGVSPASADRVLTVGASDYRDEETDFSNFGPCLDVYAPGRAIVSAKLGGGSVALDGTSMASPHVAGVAALYKAANPTATSLTVGGWLLDQSVKDVLKVSKGSPNRLLQTGGL